MRPLQAGVEKCAQPGRMIYLLIIYLLSCPPFSAHLGDVAGAGEAEGDGADGLGHEAHRDLVAAVPHGLDGLAHVPVVVGHADVLRARQEVER